MTDTVASLRRKIHGANDLQGVVRTMKALAGASIGQYEQAVRATADYARTIEQGLGLLFRARGPDTPYKAPRSRGAGAVVFGSDQGLVGVFNDDVAGHTLKTLSSRPGKPALWAVGERVHERLAESGISLNDQPFAVPVSVKAIAPLVGQILVAYETAYSQGDITEFHIIHNRPTGDGIYAPANRRLMPLDETWQRSLAERAWPKGALPEIVGNGDTAIRAFIREYLFVALFQACAESLASENAARLAAMERADRNIDTLLETLNGTSRRLRQGAIDEELFDVVSGYEALTI
jgi:F-type H+-transporting ATPase subunit gamma